MPRSDRDVFEYLRADSDSSVEIDFLAYALYAYEKFQWFEQFERTEGHPPDAGTGDRWIADITATRFANLREEAARLFDTAARSYLADEIEAQRQDAVRTSILGEVRAAGAFWRQLAVALVTAILAPLIICAIIAAALTYDHAMPTATDITGRLHPPIQQGKPPPASP